MAIRTPPQHRTRWLAAAGLVAVACWAALWTLRSYWNPLFFFGLWTGATVFVRALSGQPPWPWRRQLALMALSAPVWWWFEFVNGFVLNWRYHGGEAYSPLEYTVFATLAFSTVVPALDAACTAAIGWLGAPRGSAGGMRRRWYWGELALGVVGQAAVFAAPGYAYPLVWAGPFLALDAAAGLAGMTSLAHELCAGRWRLPTAVALAGLGCGVLWEFWNFWSLPKWTYDVPYVQVLQVFEMPVLGYGGYVPFAWSVYQAVALSDKVTGRALIMLTTKRAPGPP
jgi:hypothetical protein